MSFLERENKLIIVNCSSEAGIHKNFLIGLVSAQETENGTEGWLLIVSGSMLISEIRGVNWPIRNKIGVNNLHLTDNQKIALFNGKAVSSMDYAYLYTASFFIGKCENSDTCPIRDSDLLHFLADFLSKYEIEFDLQKVVPIKCVHVKDIIVKKRSSKSTRRHESESLLGEEKVEENAKFKFRETNSYIYIDLECPGDHPEYHVKMLLLQTLVCKSRMEEPSSQLHSITNVLEQDELLVAPGFIGRKLPITMTLKCFHLPENSGTPRLTGILEDLVIHKVEHWVKCYLSRVEDSGKEIIAVSERTNSKPSPDCHRLNKTKKGNSSCENASEGCVHTINIVVMDAELDLLEEIEDESTEDTEG